MTKGVVHLFKVVQIDKKKGCLSLIAFVLSDGLCEPFEGKFSVWKVGEGIIIGANVKLLLIFFLFGDVAEKGDILKNFPFRVFNRRD